MEDIIVIDDFLPKIQQRTIEQFVFINVDFPWNYRHNYEYANESLSEEFRKNDPNIFKSGSGLFFHDIIREEKVITDYYSLFNSFPKFTEQKFNLQIKNMFRLRVNFTAPIGFKNDFYHAPHNDVDFKNSKSLIYYINDVDGDTFFFDEYYNGTHNPSAKTLCKRITPKKNRAVLFDSLRYHAGGYSSKKARLLINFIFEI